VQIVMMSRESQNIPKSSHTEYKLSKYENSFGQSPNCEKLHVHTNHQVYQG
jgi:hypothetical protein